jgi:hypothetical protein
MLAWNLKRGWKDAGAAGFSLSVLASRAESEITHRDWLEQQKTRPDPRARSERVREFFGYGHRCSSLDARARAFLGIADDGTAEFLVSVAGRGYQVQSARMKSSMSADELAKLKTLVVPPEQARALRVQCDLTQRLESRYGRRLAHVSERAARGKFDRLITTTDGRKCAVIITDKALYLVQQGKEDWRGLIGRDVAIQKRTNGVSIQLAERSRLQVFGLGR